MKTVEVKKTKGMLFYALLCACFGIWSYVFYQIALGFSPVEDPFEALSLATVLEPGASSVPRRPGPSLTYKGDYRDPFEWPTALFAPPPSTSRRRANLPLEPPPLSLSGIIDETVLLYGEDGSVYVARVGEHAGSIEVVKVQRDYVVVRYKGRSHTLHLAQ